MELNHSHQFTRLVSYRQTLTARILAVKAVIRAGALGTLRAHYARAVFSPHARIFALFWPLFHSFFKFPQNFFLLKKNFKMPVNGGFAPLALGLPPRYEIHNAEARNAKSPVLSFFLKPRSKGLESPQILRLPVKHTMRLAVNAFIFTAKGAYILNQFFTKEKKNVVGFALVDFRP